MLENYSMKTTKKLEFLSKTKHGKSCNNQVEDNSSDCNTPKKQNLKTREKCIKGVKPIRKPILNKKQKKDKSEKIVSENNSQNGDTSKNQKFKDRKEGMKNVEINTKIKSAVPSKTAKARKLVSEENNRQTERSDTQSELLKNQKAMKRKVATIKNTKISAKIISILAEKERKATKSTSEKNGSQTRTSGNEFETPKNQKTKKRKIVTVEKQRKPKELISEESGLQTKESDTQSEIRNHQKARKRKVVSLKERNNDIESSESDLETDGSDNECQKSDNKESKKRGKVTKKKTMKLTKTVLYSRFRKFKPPRRAKNPRGVVFLNHIPHGFYEKEMRGYFSQFGKVTGVNIPRSKKTGKFKGYGFVEFLYPEVAKVAAETMDNQLMCNKVLQAKYVPPEKQKPHFFKFVYPKMTLVEKRRRYLRKENHRRLDEDETDKEKKALAKRLARACKKLEKIGVGNYTFVVGGSIPNEISEDINDIE